MKKAGKSGPVQFYNVIAPNASVCLTAQECRVFRCAHRGARVRLPLRKRGPDAQCGVPPQCGPVMRLPGHAANETTRSRNDLPFSSGWGAGRLATGAARTCKNPTRQDVHSRLDALALSEQLAASCASVSGEGVPGAATARRSKRPTDRTALHGVRCRFFKHLVQIETLFGMRLRMMRRGLPAKARSAAVRVRKRAAGPVAADKLPTVRAQVQPALTRTGWAARGGLGVRGAFQGGVQAAVPAQPVQQHAAAARRRGP